MDMKLFRKTKLSSHNIFYNGIFTIATAAHANVTAESIANQFAVCHGTDVMFYRGCPAEGSKVLNISVSAELRMGDRAVALGYLHFHDKSIPRSWDGTLLGRTGEKRENEYLNGNTHVPIHEDEFILNGVQIAGMNGGGCLNSYGYLGMVHAIDTNNQAVVLPNYRIMSCLDRLKNLLSTNCKNVEVISPPVLFKKKK